MRISTEQIVVTFIEQGRRLSETASVLGISIPAVYAALLPTGILPPATRPPTKKKAQKAPIKSVRADGKEKGRRCELTEEQIIEAVRELKTLRAAAKALGFAKPTVRRRMKTLGLTVKSIRSNRASGHRAKH
ncbi:MAG: hypothetical protein HOC28_05665 [Bacteroidetes Order II. Incertae sedis bacterium]|jgi:transposase-like protein|nr:hypothetical protein [Bacteroidetes Order II. bacterium]MDG1753847.1 hypothetical protein [Rhodothermales bacterium]HAY36993.1 hypothetical protein [Bacteroidota bacterium]MBT4053003.1 hypothetical protein [Bacteroidetes Order II. bacterium]MBT4602601.1 hypothetical protein [Bacteroidetes Order II. bacterium]